MSQIIFSGLFLNSVNYALSLLIDFFFFFTISLVGKPQFKYDITLQHFEEYECFVIIFLFAIPYNLSVVRFGFLISIFQI